MVRLDGIVDILPLHMLDRLLIRAAFAFQIFGFPGLPDMSFPKMTVELLPELSTIWLDQRSSSYP